MDMPELRSTTTPLICRTTGPTAIMPACTPQLSDTTSTCTAAKCCSTHGRATINWLGPSK
ncbi:hypothetical protein L208DRAFT_1394622 [Tricholoma matsutake]|nr:hypothetical protein L208DRAFT_1394622 [Tricholoma matsutake 945]